MRKNGNLFFVVEWQLMDTEEIMEISMEGMMDLENNLATTIVIIVLGKNHQMLKPMGVCLIRNRNFILSGSISHKILINY